MKKYKKQSIAAIIFITFLFLCLVIMLNEDLSSILPVLSILISVGTFYISTIFSDDEKVSSVFLDAKIKEYVIMTNQLALYNEKFKKFMAKELYESLPTATNDSYIKEIFASDIWEEVTDINVNINEYPETLNPFIVTEKIIHYYKKFVKELNKLYKDVLTVADELFVQSIQANKSYEEREEIYNSFLREYNVYYKNTMNKLITIIKEDLKNT